MRNSVSLFLIALVMSISLVLTSFIYLGRFTPFQLIAGTLTVLYMLKNADRMIGLGGKLLMSSIRIYFF